MAARPTHSEAALRRLELLSAELAEVRTAAPLDAPADHDADDRDPDHDPDHNPDPESEPSPEAETETEVLPMPGRHAARLPAPPSRRLPSLQPSHVAIVVLVVAAGLLAAAWWVVRAGGNGVAVPPLAATPVAGLQTPATTPTATTTATTAATSVVVDVTGDVRHPGIVVLDLGARVVDAIRAAGGPLKGTDLSTLNQARLLVDGEQIVVGGSPPPGVAASASAASVPAAPLVNLNTATQAELESLPGVGPVTAQSILDWRTANGRFTSVEELLEVDGIGDATLADLAPYVTL